jgi:thiol-disulfide isomerase/thioredoxin
MIVTAAALFTGADRTFSAWLLEVFPQYGAGLTSIENQDAVKKELALRQTSPKTRESADRLSLGSGAWINSDPLTLGGLKGKVVLVDFWTYSCINCVRTLPYLRSWDERYRADGLVIVGVHSPEFVFERSEANVRQAIKDLKVTWPVVQDNAFGIWNAYQNQYWPAHYLYDREGKLIETHFGEGNYAETEAAIAHALGVSVRTGAIAGTVAVSDGPKTPETYLGYGRGRRFSSPEPVAMDKVSTYSVPAALEPDHWALGGSWTVGSEFSTGSAGSSLVLRYQGSHVYLVMGPSAKPARVRVTVEGQPSREIVVDGQRMYTLVDGSDAGGTVKLSLEGAVQVYALTFG